MLKRFLVPTDFSPTAERAFRYALELASRTGGTVVLYHLYAPVEPGYIDNMTRLNAYNQQVETDLVKELNQLADKYKGNYPQLIVSTVLGRTPVVDNILGFAEHNAIDLIIMGTQGASGLKKALVGTIASRVIEKSDIPVLMIPERYEWKLPKNLLLATDYQAADKLALPLLSGIARQFDASVTVTRLMDGHITPDEARQEQDRFSAYTAQLQVEFADQPMEFKLIRTSSIVETMERLDDDIPYDLLALVRRKKSFLQRFLFESYTRHMAYLTNHPFLMVPDME